jgi:hypothetical protein
VSRPAEEEKETEKETEERGGEGGGRRRRTEGGEGGRGKGGGGGGEQCDCALVTFTSAAIPSCSTIFSRLSAWFESVASAADTNASTVAWVEVLHRWTKGVTASLRRRGKYRGGK